MCMPHITETYRANRARMELWHKGVCEEWVREGEGGLYSLWCHLRKPTVLVKLSEWMECFCRRPRCTFFHCGTSVCLFLFQIHSIIPDCTKHSRTFHEPYILFSTPARISNHHRPPPSPWLQHLPPTPDLSLFFPPPASIIPHHRWTRPKKTPSLSLFPSALRNLGYLRWRKALTFQAHLAGALCSYLASYNNE